MGSISVVVRKDEPFEKAVRRFRREVERAGILKETKRRMHHDKPSVKRKRKARAATRRHVKRVKRLKRAP
ncbi:MAG: 30S ribosomal protein S21 [Candidatus Binatia bacterium]